MKNFTKPSKKTICVCNRDVSTEEKRWILSVSRTGFIQAKCSLTEQSSRVNKSKFRDRSLQESKSANKPEHNFFIFSNISSILFETSAQATLVWSKICKKMHFTVYSYITVRSNAAHHCRASGNSSNGSSIAPTFPPLLSQSSLYSKQLEASGKVMSVYVGFCVCVCVLREGFGPNWHRHVKCFREPSWHPCTSKLTRSQQTEQRMNANKSADPWVTLTIPALQAMSAETGRLEGYEISLFKMGTAKKEKKNQTNT